MKKLSVGQRRALSQFFTNSAVAWLSVGVVTPFFVGRELPNIIGSSVWGMLFTLWFIAMSLFIMKGVRT